MVGIAATYLTHGRFDLAKHAPVIPVMDQANTFVGGKPGVTVIAASQGRRSPMP